MVAPPSMRLGLLSVKQLQDKSAASHGVRTRKGDQMRMHSAVDLRAVIGLDELAIRMHRTTSELE